MSYLRILLLRPEKEIDKDKDYNPVSMNFEEL